MIGYGVWGHKAYCMGSIYEIASETSGFVPLQVGGKVCSQVLEWPQSAALQLYGRRTAAGFGVEPL